MGKPAMPTIVSYDEIFGLSKEQNFQIRIIPLTDLYKYHNHPFRVVMDKKMEETINSIKEHGILTPGMARPRPGGGYELISGHRRKMGAELAGLTEMPVIIRNLNDDEADIIMVDSNIQRENLLFSEKAYAYKIKFEALKHQGKKGTEITTKQIGNDDKISGRTIQRYIRLTYLIRPLLDMVDTFKIKFQPAEKLSYLNKAEQDWLITCINKWNCYPSNKQAESLKQYSLKNELTENKVYSIMDRTKPVNNWKVMLPAEKIGQYFPADYTQKQIETVIFQLLDSWKYSKK